MRFRSLITSTCFAGLVIIGGGCGLMYGFKVPKQFDANEYDTVISSVSDEKIKTTCILSDSKQFDSYRRIVQDSSWLQTLSGQPVQMLYFRGDSLVSYHANCLARGGLLNLEWNIERRFEKFPPISATSSRPTSLSLSAIKNIYSFPDNNEYVIIVFWSTMLSKVSKKAIETVKENLMVYGNLDITSIVLINTDKYYVSLRED